MTSATAPRLITFGAEDELREHVLRLNDDGIATHIVIMDATGHSVLASLTSCYADGFAYYSPNEDGLMHCCDCAQCGPVCQDQTTKWKPAFPVVGLSPTAGGNS